MEFHINRSSTIAPCLREPRRLPCHQRSNLAMIPKGTGDSVCLRSYDASDLAWEQVYLDAKRRPLQRGRDRHVLAIGSLGIC